MRKIYWLLALTLSTEAFSGQTGGGGGLGAQATEEFTVSEHEFKKILSILRAKKTEIELPVENFEQPAFELPNSIEKSLIIKNQADEKIFIYEANPSD